MTEIRYDRSKLRGRIAEKYGSQLNFAEASGLGTATVTNILTGSYNPRSKTITIAAEALDIKMEQIGEYFFDRVPV